MRPTNWGRGDCMALAHAAPRPIGAPGPWEMAFFYILPMGQIARKMRVLAHFTRSPRIFLYFFHWLRLGYGAM